MIVVQLLSSLVPLAILVGVVVLVVRLLSKRSPAGVSGGSESVGTVLRRLFVYAAMLITLTLSAVGITGLLDMVLESGTVARDPGATALHIAFVIVALPVFVILAVSTRRRLELDPAERISTGWAFYLTVALTGSLIAAMSLVGAFVLEFFDGWSLDPTLLINAGVWTGIWAAHWWVQRHRAYAPKMQVAMLAGSAAGLIAIAAGVGGLIAAVLDELYTTLFLTAAVESGIDPMIGSLVTMAVGVPVWWLYWIRTTLAAPRTPLWLVYVLLFGVLGGAIAVIVGLGVTLFGGLQWLIGDPGVDAAAHFEFLPGAAAAIAVGASSWAYHGKVLGEREARVRTEVDRVYDYLLGGSGLVVAAGGLATLIAIGVDALGSREIAATTTGDAAAVAITLLAIGAPLWWRYWSTIQRYRRQDPAAELASPTRRVYLFLLFGLSSLIAMIDLVVLVTITITDVLEGSLGSNTLSAVAVPVALLLTTGAVGWYHLTIFREDRADMPERATPMLREVILVSSDGSELAAALSASTQAQIRRLPGTGRLEHLGSIEQVVAAVADETHPRVVILDAEEAGWELVALDS